jgi:hypothetical protein
MIDKKDKNKKKSNSELATEAAVKALLPVEQFPCKADDKACTKRWLETQTDCA